MCPWYIVADAPQECDFAVVEHLDVEHVIQRYRELYARGRHGAPPDTTLLQRLYDHGDDWVRAVIPLEALNFQTEEDSGPARIERARQYAARGETFPPGVAVYAGRGRKQRTGKAYVLDGNHRALAALYRGDCSIEMFMPSSEFVAVVEDAR